MSKIGGSQVLFASVNFFVSWIGLCERDGLVLLSLYGGFDASIGIAYFLLGKS